MLNTADIKLANTAPSKPRDPRAIVCPLTGHVIGLWTGKVASK